MNRYKFIPLLSLFDEGGAGSGVTSSAAGSENGSSKVAGSERNAKDLSNVIYGKQNADADTDAQGMVKDTASGDNGGSVAGNEVRNTNKEKAVVGSDEDFDALIKGEFKDAFNKRVKSIVDRRTRDMRTLEKYKTDTNDLVGLLAGKYGVKSDDITALTKAIREDDSFFEEAAYAEGLTVEQYKYKLKLEKENEALRNAQETADRQRAANERMTRWNAEAERLSELYPGFDLNSEAQNPTFLKLLQSGIDVKTAFEVVHNDEIVSGAMRVTADAVRKQVTDNIRARGMRPSEAGARSSAATIVKSDPSKFTKEDRAEIARRARRGEKIVL
ncbi:MAG: hypothetical protein E7583_03085 [Ruminococcaceae bacterium]|nr:hypothetical protein [Oscillospiraceae bacterium]